MDHHEKYLHIWIPTEGKPTYKLRGYALTYRKSQNQQRDRLRTKHSRSDIKCDDAATTKTATNQRKGGSLVCWLKNAMNGEKQYMMLLDH